MNGRDPVVRYAALALLCLGVLGAGAVALHGYWTNSAYMPPPLVVYVLGAAFTTAIHVLGVQQGSEKVQSGVDQGAAVARNGTSVNIDKAA